MAGKALIRTLHHQLHQLLQKVHVVEREEIFYLRKCCNLKFNRNCDLLYGFKLLIRVVLNFYREKKLRIVFEEVILF
jgi:hypothetical protein